MANPLKRGADPYADAAEARALLRPITNHLIDATKWAAGTSIWGQAPQDTYLRRARAVVIVANSANIGVILIKSGTNTLATLTVASGAAAGVTYAAKVTDDAGENNKFDAGESFEIECDGVPSAGEVLVTLEWDIGTE